MAAAQAAEDHAADECRDEAGAAERVGDAVREHGRRDRDDLKPHVVDEAMPPPEHDDRRRDRPGDHSADAP